MGYFKLGQTIGKLVTKKQYKKKLDKLLGPPDEVFGHPLKDFYMKKFNKPKAKNVTPKGKK